jgi:L-amino acid N-acyltransferase YncA
MATKAEIGQRYPKTIELDEGQLPPGPSFLRVRPSNQPQVRPVLLRLMAAPDRDSMLLLARHLPQEHLLFLHSDISQPANVDEWLNDIEKGTTFTLLAEPDGTLEGYASLHLSSVRWTRRIGEIAINVAPEWQSRGLGEALCTEIVSLGEMLGLRKLTAQMVAEHKNARAMFERLAFRIQAFLPEWVEDQEGRNRDLLLMAYDLPAPERKAPASG